MGPFLKSSCLPLWFLVHMLQFRSHFIKDHWWQVAQRQLTLAGSGLGWDWKWSVKHCVISDCPAFLTTIPVPPPSLHFFTVRWIFPGREREQERERRRAKRCNSPLSVLWMPLATEWSRLVLAVWVRPRVCVFVLPWSASGLGGGFSSGRPVPVDLCIAAPVLCRKANVDASHCTAAVPRSLSRHHTSRTLDLNQAVLCQKEAPTTQKGVVAVFR